MKRRWIILLVIAVVVIIGASIFLLNMKNINNENSEVNNLDNSGTPNVSNNTSNVSTGKTNIEYFQELKPITKVNISTINCRLMNADEDFSTVNVPISSEEMDKFAPFTVSNNTYESWDEFLNSSETVEAEEFLYVQGEKLIDTGPIYLWNAEKENRSVKECFEDGNILIGVAKFTFGMYSADYLGKPEGFVGNHEMLDTLFEKFGTPKYYKYIANGTSSLLQLIFEYENCDVYVEIYPGKTKDGLEYFSIQDITYCGGRTLEIIDQYEIRKTGKTRYTKTNDVNKMIEEYLKNVEY